MARASSKKPPKDVEPELTHWIAWDTPRTNRGRRARAACGTVVDVVLSTNSPTCVECADYVQENEREGRI